MADKGPVMPSSGHTSAGDPSDMAWTYAILTAQAVAPIILGSFKSLRTPRSVKLARRRALRAARARSRVLQEDLADDEYWANEAGGEEDEDTEGEMDETLGWGDTLLFPFLGSAVLLGFYALIRWAGTRWVNLVLGVYFSGAGMFAFHSTLNTLISFFLRTIGRSPKVYHLRMSSELKQLAHCTFTIPSLFLLPLSIALPAAYIPLGRPYILSNAIALCLGTATLQVLRLDSFATAGLLLGVLLVYDIFWVFATPVMVTVAKNLDAPIKLLAPKRSRTGSGVDYAMLGLGDVVIPGLMIALCLRFDLARHAQRHPGRTDIGPRASFARPYFWVGVLSYLAGLGTTMGVMQWAGRAQPALLYLSPACFLGPLLLALVRGELKELWAYTEAEDDNAADKDKGKDGEKARLLDETIEPPSEVAQRARQAARDGAAVGAVDAEAGAEAEANGGGVTPELEAGDDTWMEGGVAGGAGAGATGGTRKRKGKKK